MRHTPRLSRSAAGMRARSLLALAAIAAAAAQLRAEHVFNITAIRVPDSVDLSVSDSVEIECRYDADFTTFMWWKDHREFFRYEPGATPSTRSFPAGGVSAVEVLECGPTACRLRLDLLSEEASGDYRCDLERIRPPPARYAAAAGRMRVRGGDVRRPAVEGLRAEYGPGERIEAVCAGAADSRLGWYVNGRHAADGAALRLEATRVLFRGSRAQAAVQCVELSAGGKRGSTTTMVRWRDAPSAASERPPEEQRSASSALHLRRYTPLAVLVMMVAF